VQYFQIPTNAPLSLSTYSATSAGGAAAVVAHYVQDGGTFRLLENAAPGPNGTASATDIPSGNTLNAVVAIPVNFSGSGTVALGVTGAIPKGVGLTEVPNTLPNQSPPGGVYQSTASVYGARLSSNVQRDMYFVQLPYNLNASTSSLVYTPADSTGSLAAVVMVLNSSNGVLATATTTAGQGATIPITGLVADQTLRFEVQAVSGSNVGGGGYSLSTTVTTTNTSAFLVTEQAFFNYGSGSFPELPNATPVTLAVNTTDNGSFTSSTPYNTSTGVGSIQVYSLTGFPGQQSYTVSTHDSNTTVNVNIAVYYGEPLSGSATKWVQAPGNGPNFDYYPSDRSLVDAQVVFNNYDLDPTYVPQDVGSHSYPIIVVVENEQGSLGSYSITLSTPNPVTTTGPGAGVTSANDLIVSANTGSGYITSQGAHELVNGTTYPVRIPNDAGTGPSTLTASVYDGTSGETVTVHVYSVSKFGVGILLGTYSGVINSDEYVNIAVGNLSHGALYNMMVASSSLSVYGMNLSLAVPFGGTSPAPAGILSGTVPQDASYNGALNRLEPSPTGALSGIYNISGGTGYVGGYFTSAFSVATEGTVTLNVAYPAGSSGVYVGLYQSGQQGVGTYDDEPYSSIGVLLDYVNAPGTNGLYSFIENLAPGTYFLSGTGTVPSGGTDTATVTGTIPAVAAQVLNINPGTGMTLAAEDTIINEGAYATNGVDDYNFLDSRYITRFYAVTAPANANGSSFSVELYDNDANLTTASAGYGGTASITLWQVSNGVYTEIGSGINALNEYTATDIAVNSTVPTVPGATYFIGIDLNAYSGPIYVSPTVPIYTSGLADFSVGPITLTSDLGQTLAQGSIINASYSASQPTTYVLQLGSITATRNVPAAAPFGAVLVTGLWTPVSSADQVSVTVNPGDTVPEASFANDYGTPVTPLSVLDPHSPTVTIALASSVMTGEGSAAPSTGGSPWGRYIAGVKNQSATILFTGNDNDSDLYDITGMLANGNSGSYSFNSSQTIFVAGTQTSTNSISFDFGSLAATAGGNINEIEFYAIDQFGLRTPTYTQPLNVIAPPSYLTGGIPAPGINGAGGAISFNNSTHQFTYSYQDTLLGLNQSLSAILGFDVPVIGDTSNGFTLSINGAGSGGYDATVSVPTTVSGHVNITAVSSKVYDMSYMAPSGSSNFSFQSQGLLSGATLLPSSLSVDLQVMNLTLASDSTKLIPLISVGVPGIASLSAGIKFGVKVTLSGAAKLGIDPNTINASGYLGSIGVMSPTFLQPAITGTASVVGQADVLGFDVANVTGSVGLTLSLTIGLDNNIPGKVIAFSDAADDLAIDVDAKLTIGIAASIPIIGNIFTYNYTKDLGNIVNTISNGIFLSDPPSFASGKFIAPPTPGVIADADPADDPVAVTRTGTSLVGAYAIDPTPQIAIDNVGGTSGYGFGLSAQVVNVGTANAPTGNLAVASRANGSSAWSSLTTLSEANDVSDPAGDGRADQERGRRLRHRQRRRFPVDADAQPAVRRLGHQLPVFQRHVVGI
jgi:hypothetical protein